MSGLIVSREALYGCSNRWRPISPARWKSCGPSTNFVWAKCERAGELFDALEKRQGIIVRRTGEYLRGDGRAQP